MKRGLKVSARRLSSSAPVVTTATPMKRGLKGEDVFLALGAFALVTTATPMKRGLKAQVGTFANDDAVSYNRYPDEKGTERPVGAFFLWFNSSYNRYPDEKGTESHEKAEVSGRYVRVTTATPMKRGLKVSLEWGYTHALASYNRYPDEKGTESKRTFSVAIHR